MKQDIKGLNELIIKLEQKTNENEKITSEKLKKAGEILVEKIRIETPKGLIWLMNI